MRPRDCNLPIFTANETITNLMQYELCKEESDLLKASLYFSIQPDKIRKSEIFTKDSSIHDSFRLISDTSKFKKLNEDPTLKRETSLQRFLRKLKQRNFLMKLNMINCILPGSVRARIYGTPKMHKFFSSDSFPKLRPIVSSIGTFSYNLASFLCDLLSPLVPHYYSCKVTFSFVSQIKNANFYKTSLVYYNVTSLFTNIPLQGTIDIAISFIFNHNPNLNITRKELKEVFLFATSQTHFTFNSKFYNQIDGAAMGSPVAPVLANIFIGFHECKWLNEFNLNKPKFYLRYVDGILAAFDNEQDSLDFLGFFK